MGDRIAQSDIGFGENSCSCTECTVVRREEHPTQTADVDVMKITNNSRSDDGEKLHELGVCLAMVPGDAAATGMDEVRPARKRRHHRRGKNLHRHRLSKHRRDQRARSSRVIGAPRNDNEFLMSQYNEGLHLRGEQISDPQETHTRLFCQSCPSAAVPVDDFSCQLFSPRMSSPDGSVYSNRSSLSDFSSLPSSPDEESRYHGYRELFPASHSQPERTVRFESGSGVVMEGTDANFLRKNFEEEYTNNITRSLEEETKEELISKCMTLMEKLKQLEQRKYSRVAANVSREASLFC